MLFLTSFLAGSLTMQLAILSLFLLDHTIHIFSFPERRRIFQILHINISLIHLYHKLHMKYSNQNEVPQLGFFFPPHLELFSLSLFCSQFYLPHILSLSHKDRGFISYLSLIPWYLAQCQSHKMHVMNIYNELQENAIWDYIKHEMRLYFYILNLLAELPCLCSYCKL